jgi:HEAT repeat protein
MPLIKAANPAAPAPTRPPDDPRFLRADLCHGDAAQRRAAARGLVHYPDADGDLAARFGEEPDPSVRDAILTTLISHATPAAAAGLLPYLRASDATLRSGAIEALQSMPDVVAPFVDDLLADPDSDVRIRIVNVLAGLRHADVPRWLERVARTDPQVNVCAAAIEGLAEAGDLASAPALRTVSARFPEDPFIGYAAGLVLRRIGE